MLRNGWQNLGLDDYFSEVLPHEKAAAIRKIQECGLIVAMVGDGIKRCSCLSTSRYGNRNWRWHRRSHKNSGHKLGSQ